MSAKFPRGGGESRTFFSSKSIPGGGDFRPSPFLSVRQRQHLPKSVCSLVLREAILSSHIKAEGLSFYHLKIILNI